MSSARAGCACVLAVLALLPIGEARADHALSVTAVGGHAPRVDGALGDFRGVRFTRIGRDDDGALEYALGYDDQALYLGARVLDDELVRSAQPGPREDAVVLTFAMPRARGALRVSELWLFAGLPGRQPSVAALGAPGERPRVVREVTVVEGPLAGAAGYVLEARVPWSAIPGGEEAQVGRGALRLVDVDGKLGGEAQVSATAAFARPASLPPLLLSEGPNAAVRAFLAHELLPPDGARFDLVGQVAGDARLDRVVLAGTFVIVAGLGIDRDGGYHYLDLPVTGAASVLDAELRELTGDDRLELVVRLEQQNELGRRELLSVIALGPGQPRSLLGIELKKETAQGSVEAELAFGRERPPSLEVSSARAQGLAADSYAEQPASGVEPILLPWGEVSRRSYRWDGARFAVVREEPNPDAREARAAVSSRVAPAEPTPVRVVHPEPPGTDELVAAFRAARSVPEHEVARFEQHANVAEDARIESLMLFGADLLVIGEGYQQGTGYFFYGLPVHDGRDVQRMFTVDVTGDGRRELFVRHQQRIGDVQREILRAYTFTAEGMDELLAVEVRRAQGASSIGNVVDIVRVRGRWALRISPGLARGWSAASYPFAAEPSDGYGALLLPWRDRVQLYDLRQDRLVPAAR